MDDEQWYRMKNVSCVSGTRQVHLLNYQPLAWPISLLMVIIQPGWLSGPAPQLLVYIT